jgi:hypothetical protein
VRKTGGWVDFCENHLTICSLVIVASKRMSEVASVIPFGEFHSALFYRDLFLRDDTEYKPFWCPFCGIKLFACLVYEPADTEMAMSPHFKRPKGVEHRHGCDGNPAAVGAIRTSNDSVRKIEKQLFILPTRLVDYIEPPARVESVDLPPVPSPDEVRKRRVRGGEIHHRARFSVALVQSVAEAHLGTISQAYKLQKEKKWTDKARGDWLKSIFSAEIDLRGSTMKYRDALHDLYFPIRSTPRIYYCEGVVTVIDDGYSISAARRGKTSDTDKIGMPFTVVVRPGSNSTNLRGARRALMAQLERAATKGFQVKWYGYGLPERTALGFELRFWLDNLSDLFVRRQTVNASVGWAKQPQTEATKVVESVDIQPVKESVINQTPAPLTPPSSYARQFAPEVAERAPVHSTVIESARGTAVQSATGTETVISQDAWLAAVERECAAYWNERIEAARVAVVSFRESQLEPHHQRKPLLWGRSAWKAKLAELDAQDQRNVAQLKRLQHGSFTPQETEAAKREAERRARLSGAGA